MINKTQLCFRRMLDADLESVLKLEVAGHAVPWAKGIFVDCLRAGCYCVLLEFEKQLIAYGIMSAAASEAHILNVCVNNKFLRQGFGRIVILHLLAAAKQNKVRSVFLEVRPSNKVAVHLYESLGFLEI
ncbi:MAG TPA: GNAT family N-acetyltransferase, partial [Gammaproteobacteria bacterium]|nr:GNAT family N-acetyltransferase [Gammaproteobacteria bacterium]